MTLQANLKRWQHLVEKSVQDSVTINKRTDKANELLDRLNDYFLDNDASRDQCYADRNIGLFVVVQFQSLRIDWMITRVRMMTKRTRRMMNAANRRSRRIVLMLDKIQRKYPDEFSEADKQYTAGLL